jgi:hypothetical protein
MRKQYDSAKATWDPYAARQWATSPTPSNEIGSNILPLRWNRRLAHDLDFRFDAESGRW